MSRESEHLLWRRYWYWKLIKKERPIFEVALKDYMLCHNDLIYRRFRKKNIWNKNYPSEPRYFI